VRGVGLAVGLALLGLAAFLSYGWSQHQYYVAAYDGRVAIYQGVQADLPGVTLHHVYASEDLLLTELPTFRRSQVLDGLQADDLDHAHSIVDKLETFASTCAAQAAASSASTQPTAASSEGQTPPPVRPTTTATGTRGATRTASPSTAPATRGRPVTSSTPSSRGTSATSATPSSRGTPPTSTSSTPPTSTSSTPTTSATTGTGGSDNAPAECAGATPQPQSTS